MGPGRDVEGPFPFCALSRIWHMTIPNRFAITDESRQTFPVASPDVVKYTTPKTVT